MEPMVLNKEEESSSATLFLALQSKSTEKTFNAKKYIDLLEASFGLGC